MARLLRILHLGHRWLGIGIGLMVLLWFASGLIMLFVARPQLDDAERLALLPPIAARQLHVTPAAAWQALMLPGEPQAIRLTAAGGRAAYRFLAGQQWHAVDAGSGQVLSAPDADAARRLLQPLAARDEVVALESVRTDQWTLFRRYDELRPFWRVVLRDGRSFYISTRSREVVLDTTRSERAWNWLGSAVHWVYITPLRQNTVLWRHVVLWGTTAALLLAASGVWLGVQRLRLRPRYRDGRCLPYRRGCKRWHHILGLAGGLILLSWLISGWLLMAPFGLGRAPQPPGPPTPLASATLREIPLIAAGTREIEWRTLGEGIVRVERHIYDSRISLAGAVARPALELPEIVAVLSASGRPAVAAARWLTEADDRYYPLRHHPRRFPVARVELADAAHSVLYVSPRDGRVELASNRDDFTYRWLRNGLHRLDFPLLVAHPRWRDALIVILAAAGLALCATGCLLAWRRLRGTPDGSGATRERGRAANSGSPP